MIKVQVFLKNDYDRDYIEVEISKEELLQLACDKAKERYVEGHWHTITADEVEVKANVA